MINVFISYGTPDREAALEIFDFLKLHGFQPWMDKMDLLPGVRWRAAIEEALARSDVCVFLLSSRTAQRRGFFQKEMRLALDRSLEMLDDDIFIVPIRLDNCEIPERLAEFQYLDFFVAPEWARLLPSLTEAAEQRGKLASTIEKQNPIVGKYCEIKDGADYYEFEATYPKLEFPTRAHLASSVNAVVMGKVNESLLRFRREAIEDFRPDFSTPSRLQIKITPTHISNEILSFRELNYLYFSGAAHGNYGETSLNIDPDTGAMFSFLDCMSETDSLYRFLREEIVKIGDNPIVSDDGIHEAIISSVANKTWLGADHVNFHFNPYEIFCFARGPIDITVARSEFERLFTKHLTAFGRKVINALDYKKA